MCGPSLICQIVNTLFSMQKQKLLMEKLIRMDPIHLSCKDMWVWGSSRFYTTANGFKILQFSTQTKSMPSFWFIQRSILEAGLEFTQYSKGKFLYLDSYAPETFNQRKIVKKRFLRTLQIFFISSSCRDLRSYFCWMHFCSESLGKFPAWAALFL